MPNFASVQRGERLSVFWTQVGRTREWILPREISLSKSWTEWKMMDPLALLRLESN